MILEIRDLTVGYDGNAVLQGIHLDLAEGEIVTLVGANGAGKSTLVRTIAGIQKPMAGSIAFRGKALHTLSPSQRILGGIALVPEGRQVFAGLTVRENLMLGAYATHGTVDSEHHDRFEEVLDLFPVLRQRLESPAGNFSGGQQQMLAIGRGLMSGPRLLMLDEPSLGLSPLLVGEIFELIRTLRQKGITILLSEQNARSALAIADRGYVLENGRIAMSGKASEMLHSPEIAERYLGAGVAPAIADAESQRLAARLRDIL